MDKNKKSPGHYKAKNMYLLSGLIYCGECEHSIPECKKFIQNYVERVVVFKDKVEVTFRVVVDEDCEGQAYMPKSSMRKKELFKGRKKRLAKNGK